MADLTKMKIAGKKEFQQMLKDLRSWLNCEVIKTTEGYEVYEGTLLMLTAKRETHDYLISYVAGFLYEEPDKIVIKV